MLKKMLFPFLFLVTCFVEIKNAHLKKKCTRGYYCTYPKCGELPDCKKYKKKNYKMSWVKRIVRKTNRKIVEKT